MLGMLGLRIHPVVRLLIGAAVIVAGFATDRRAWMLVGGFIIVYGLVGLVGLLGGRKNGSRSGGTGSGRSRSGSGASR